MTIHPDLGSTVTCLERIVRWSTDGESQLLPLLHFLQFARSATEDSGVNISLTSDPQFFAGPWVALTGEFHFQGPTA